VRALHERVRMMENAPHLTRKLDFLVPSYNWIDLSRSATGRFPGELIRLDLGDRAKTEILDASPTFARALTFTRR
jgi:glycerol-3-phosphate dehydrogenase